MTKTYVKGPRAHYHGGFCCGITTIYLGNVYSSDNMWCRARTDNTGNRVTAIDHSQRREKYGLLPRPAETILDRLDWYIEKIKQPRPSGIIEIVLATGSEKRRKQEPWIPVLEERGFKCVSTAKNSNSGNTIRVYHLVTGSKQ